MQDIMKSMGKKLPRYMRYILFIGIVLLCILSLINIGSAKTITVDDDQEGDYPTLQDAIDNADEGDTIFIYNGTYNNFTTIDKQVKIIGESENNVIFNHSKGAFNIVANNVSIDKMSIINSTNNFPSTILANNTSLDHIIFVSRSANLLTYGFNITISNSRFNNRVTIEQSVGINIISCSGIENAQIRIVDSMQGVIENNSNLPIFLLDSNNFNINCNNFTNESIMISNVLIRNSHGISMERNSYSHISIGVHIENCTSLIIENSTFDNNSAGVSSSQSNVTIHNSTFTSNIFGDLYFDSSHARIFNTPISPSIFDDDISTIISINYLTIQCMDHENNNKTSIPIVITNNQNDTVFMGTTDNHGLIENIPLETFLENKSGIDWYTPFIIIAGDYENGYNSTQFNFTESSKLVLIIHELPDYIPLGIVLENSMPNEGDTIFLNATIANNGGFSHSVIVRFDNETSIIDEIIIEIGPYSSAVASIIWQVPKTSSEIITISVNPDKLIIESNYSNNILVDIVEILRDYSFDCLLSTHELSMVPASSERVTIEILNNGGNSDNYSIEISSDIVEVFLTQSLIFLSQGTEKAIDLLIISGQELGTDAVHITIISSSNPSTKKVLNLIIYVESKTNLLPIIEVIIFPEQNISETDDIQLFSNSSDPDGYIIEYKWIIDEIDIFYGQIVSVRLTPGEHTLQHFVTDDAGELNNTAVKIYVNKAQTKDNEETITFEIIIIIILIILISVLFILLVNSKKKTKNNKLF